MKVVASRRVGCGVARVSRGGFAGGVAAATLFAIAGCAGRYQDRSVPLGSGRFQEPIVESPRISASSTLSTDHLVATVLFEDVSARVDGVGVAERFVALEFPVSPQGVGRVPIHLHLRGGAIVSDGSIEVWQMAPTRRLLWNSRGHSGGFHTRTTLAVDFGSSDLVAGELVAPKIGRASFYLRAASSGPHGALLQLDSIDAAFDSVD